jgi:hypothetical protein
MEYVGVDQQHTPRCTVDDQSCVRNLCLRMIVERLSGRRNTLTGLATVCQLEFHVLELP